MRSGAGRPTEVRATLVGVAPWIALLAGFSPVIADLARNLCESPEDSSFLLAAFLFAFAVAASRHRPAAAASRGGLLVLGAGVALELLGVVTGSWSLARLGLPLAALGVARLRGHPPVAVMGLAFLAVPIPDSLVELPSPALESGSARVAGRLMDLVGVSVDVVGFSLIGEQGRVDLKPSDGGIHLGACLAALGWYSIARRRGSLGMAAARAALCGLLALPVQIVGVVLAGILASRGAEDDARLWLTYGVWLSAGVLGLAALARLHAPHTAAGDASPVR